LQELFNTSIPLEEREDLVDCEANVRLLECLDVLDVLDVVDAVDEYRYRQQYCQFRQYLNL
jgi:hypothetical protein